MRMLAPRPLLLGLTVILIVAAIALIQLRFNAAQPADTQAQTPPPSTEEKTTPAKEPQETTTEPEKTTTKPERNTESTQTKSTGTAGAKKAKPEPKTKPKPGLTEEERISRKGSKYPRAAEIVDPTGYINTDGISIGQFSGEKVVLLQFWTYSCYNCQNAQPFINGFHEKYAGDGLQVIGIHKPEFEFEKDYASVAQAVRDENIQYPVVLDNNDGTWNAYNNRYWPAWYLIDADGFVRYKHFGEGAYEETEKKIQDLLAERDANRG